MYGEGEAVVIGADGLAATWKGQRVGKFAGAARSVIGARCTTDRLRPSWHD